MTPFETAAETQAPPVLKPLMAYGIDPVRGFLPAQDPPSALPPAFAAWDALAARMPFLLRAGRFRAEAAGVAELDASGLDGPDAERAFLLLTGFASAWVFGEAPANPHLPANLARPLAALAAALDRPAIAAHATLVLHNWVRPDPDRPLGLDNVDTAYDFLGGVDEKWFFLATLGVELAGAPLLVALHDAATRSAAPDADLAAPLEEAATRLDATIAALEDMRRWCDPHVFYRRLRPFLASWPAPGLVLEGTGLPPQPLPGGSAAQSSLLQAVDAALGIRHPSPLTGEFLTGMRRFMPRAHRAFLGDLEAASRVRENVLRAGPDSAAARAYDACIAGVAELRRRHMALAADYITKQSGGADATGTGGTPFNDFLRAARRETRDSAVAAKP
jgi:indoleamine 2,3-dioxygenase